MERKESKIKFSQEKINTIKEHFNEADSALLIKNPSVFIEDVTNCFSGDCNYDLIRYFNMSILTVDRLSFLFGVEDILNNNEPLKINTENVYRHLYCKDFYFQNQQEFRFVAKSSRIDEPELFDIEMNSEFDLISINDFFNGVNIGTI